MESSKQPEMLTHASTFKAKHSKPKTGVHTGLMSCLKHLSDSIVHVYCRVVQQLEEVVDKFQLRQKARVTLADAQRQLPRVCTFVQAFTLHRLAAAGG